MHPFLNTAFKAVRKASHMMLQMQARLETLTISKKGESDYVSEVDKQAEAILVDAIRTAYPDHGIIAEEGTVINRQAVINWIIDPLDGTTNYLHGLPQFCISIAVQVKGKITHGLIYEPWHEALYTASLGCGAHCNDRRMRVSQHKELGESLIATGLPYRNRDHLPAYMAQLQTLYHHIDDMRRSGSAALDLAYVACGRLDGYFEWGLKPWDIAAGALMVKEAGGFVSDLSGGQAFLQSGHILAANNKIFQPLQQLLASSPGQGNPS